MDDWARLTVFACVSGLISAVLTASPVMREGTAAVGGLIVLTCMSWKIAIFTVKFAFARLIALPATDKSIILTGNESVTETAIIEKLCKSGFKVFACVRNRDGVFADKLRSVISSDKIVICEMVRSDKSSIDKCFQEITEKLNKNDKIWGLVTTCGFPFISQIDWGNFDSDVRQVIDGDVIGLLHLVRECLPLLRSHAGRIVNITSCPEKKAFHCASAISNSTSHSLMECVRREITYFGVDVVNVHTDYGLQTLGLKDQMSTVLEESWQATDESMRCQTQLQRVRKELHHCTGTSCAEALYSITNTIEHALRVPYPEFTYHTSTPRKQPLQFLASLFSG